MITHQTAPREARPTTAPFFSEVDLRKFVLASELCIPRPYFMRHSIAKNTRMAPSSIYFLKKVAKTKIKVENFILHLFIAIVSKRQCQ